MRPYNACEWCGAVGSDVERIEIIPGRTGKGGTVIEFAVHAYACVVHRESARETWTDAKVRLRRPAKNVEQRSIFDVLHEPKSALNGND